jgi:hypothetical protein
METNFEINVDDCIIAVVATGTKYPAEPSVGYMEPYIEIESLVFLDCDDKRVTVSRYNYDRAEQEAMKRLNNGG